MKTTSKAIALLLTLVLLFSSIGFNKVYADESENGDDAVTAEPMTQEPEEPVPQKNDKDPTEARAAWRYSRPASFSGGMSILSNGTPTTSPEVVDPDLVPESGLAPGQVRMTKTAALVSGKVNEWDITLRVAGRPKSVTSDIVLVMDVSGSMGYDIPDMPEDRMYYAKEAARSFINAVMNEDPVNTRIAIVKFNNTVSTVQPLLGNDKRSDLIAGINGLSASSFTHTQAGIARARSILSASGATKRTIVLFSDGLPNRSYAINTPTVADFYSDTKLSRKDLAKSRFNYESTVSDGNTALTQGGVNYKYSSPNSTIAEGAIARLDGYNLYTIGMYAGTEGQATLNETAPGKAYASDAAGLNAVFQEIAGLLGSPVATAVVTDPMASGFVQTGTITKTSGTAVYDGDEHKLTWSFPSLTQSGTGDIKFEQLTYRIKITEDTPYTDGLLPTNGATPMSFTDVNGVDSVNYFQIPQVNPVFVTLDKILLDAQGDEISSTKAFTITIDGQTYSISPDDPVKLIKKVWNVGTYPVVEAAEDPPYIVTYSVNGSAGNQISLAQNGPDQDVVVTNRVNVAKVTLGGTKQLTGRTGTSPADVFNFTLSSLAGDKLPPQVTDQLTFNGNGSQDFAFGEISYILTDLGGASSKTFTYQVAELDEGIPGMIYDSNLVRQVTVTLSKDANGILSVSVSPASVDFVNRYSAASTTAVISGSKQLSGRTGEFSDVFNFTLSAVTGTPMPDPATASLTFTANGTKTFSFPAITYNFSDLDGAASKVFNYQVTEENGGIAGINYGTPLDRPVKVTVTDLGNGTLSAVVDQTADLAYKNSYSATPVTAVISGSKQLSGRTGDFSDVFNFTLSASSGTPMPDPATASLTFTANGTKTFSFPAITYTLGDLGGAASKTFTYQVEEIDDGILGIDYDSNLVRTVTVTVTDLGNGTLSAVVDETANLAYKNSYSATPVTAVISGSKELSGRTGSFSDTFTFILTPKVGAPMPSTATKNLTFTANGNQDFEFGPITYTLAHLGGASSKEFSYEVTEIHGGIPGIYYGGPYVRDVEVTVTDNGDGTLSAVVTPQTSLNYENSYSADPTSVVIQGTKQLSGRTGSFSDTFEFTLSAAAGTPLPDPATVSLTFTANGTKTFNFPAITYTLGDLGGAASKVFNYQVTEANGGIPGISYGTPLVRDVKVTVTDLGDGTMEAVIDYLADLVYENSYSASGSYTPLATKTVVGGELAAGEFEFELLDSSYKLLQKVKNEADGTIPFAPLTFDLGDAGKTRIFIIRELEGNRENLIYDTDERLLTLSIRDMGKGVLEIVRDPDEEALEFTNLYELVGGEEDVPVTGEGRTTYFYLGILMIPLALAALSVGLSRRRRRDLNG